MPHDPDQPFGPGDDPGGPFTQALRSVARDVLLGQFGDWVDGPPGYFWAGLTTASFLVPSVLSWALPSAIPLVPAPPTFSSLVMLGDRCRWWMVACSTTHVTYASISLTAWLAFKVARSRVSR